MRSSTKVILIAAGAFFLLPGLWAFFAPASFYEQLATFPPYNEHLIHDIGAFQIGIGVVLLAAIRWMDAPFVVLTGAAVGSTFHFAAHVIDREAGGQATDFLGLGLLVVALVFGAVQRARTLAEEGRPVTAEPIR